MCHGGSGTRAPREEEAVNNDPVPGANIRVVFLTDVAGIFDKPPGRSQSSSLATSATPSLIENVFVDEAGEVFEVIMLMCASRNLLSMCADFAVSRGRFLES